MPKRIIKSKATSHANLVVITLAVFCGFLTVVLLFALLRLNGQLSFQNERITNLRSAAIKTVADRKNEAIPLQLPEGDITVSVEKFGGYAYRGQSDVRFLQFSLIAKKEEKLHQLIFSLDGYARPRDVQTLQLYLEGKFMAEVPFFEGKGIFDDLNISLTAGEKASFEVKGKVGEEAFPGDRIQIGFKNAGAFSIRDNDASLLKIEGDFPLWGGYISIIGDKRG